MEGKCGAAAAAAPQAVGPRRGVRNVTAATYGVAPRKQCASHACNVAQEFAAEEKEFSLPYQNGLRGRGSQPPEGTSASSTGTTPRQMKAGSEQSPSGITSLTPREAARFSAARKRSRLILAAWA